MQKCIYIRHLIVNSKITTAEVSSLDVCNQKLKKNNSYKIDTKDESQGFFALYTN